MSSHRSDSRGPSGSNPGSNALPGEGGAGGSVASSTAAPAPELTPRRIDALIRLLGDDSMTVHGAARGHLIASIDITRPYLERRSKDNSNPDVRDEARRLLHDIARDQRLEDWARFVAGGRGTAELDLERGAFLIASVEYPDLDADRYCSILDDCGRILAGRLSRSPRPETLVAKLSHLLFREMKLHGNREEYDDPENSYLNRVLDRRLGIPISLSVIAMLVARRVRFELEGVGMPGHFLLRYRSGGREYYLDPFNGGRAWSLEDCVQYLRNQGHDLREEYLRAYTTREILIRMLANLLGIFRQRGDEERVQRVSAMLEALQ